MGLSLRLIGDELLRRQMPQVTDFGKRLVDLMPSLASAMREEGGIGLAANQVGIEEHFAILLANIDDEEREEDEILFMANIRIIEKSSREVMMEEGCLSIPGLRADLKRPESIRVRFQDANGELTELQCDGLLARAIQHELDHLEGLLFIDRLSPARRKAIDKELALIKQQARAETGAGE